MILVRNRFGKVISIAKTWRQSRLDSQASARKSRAKDNWLLDARSGASLMSGGTLGAMSTGRAGWDKEVNGGRPVRTWKAYPHRDGRTTRQWRAV